MKDAAESLPSDLAAAHAMILVERTARLEAEAVAASAKAEAAGAHADRSSHEALIAHLKLEIEKLRRELYGTSSERKARLLQQMELQLEDLEAAATEDELASEKAAAGAQTVRPPQRKRPLRKPFPDHLPRERVVIAAPESCPCCRSARLSKRGEDITETLEVVPRSWKVIQTVRERFSCRNCETITQPPAPFHVTPRGFAGPNLLAMIMFEKFGQHQPLNRQSERYRREGIDLSLSTLADQVGACTTVLQPLHALIEAHVLAADRLHGTIPISGFWRRARRSGGTSGPMSGTIGPLAVAHRRRRCITPRGTDGTNIPSGIFETSPAFCRPMPIMGTTNFTGRPAHRGRSRRRYVGRTQDGSSSNWRILPPMPGAVGTRRQSHLWLWKRSGASMYCSISSAPSTA
jgi:transposase